MSITWTEDQRKVIETRDRNLLVSAAAGSGKTAVLVERILSRITDAKHPVDADRLLITTFTKAAAGEMKERIGKALLKRLEEDPGNEWLQRQEALVQRAQITTIHGFCLYVIRNYFHVIGLNPNFRIADEGEMRLLKQDTVDELLEDAHKEKQEAFLRFAESYGSGNRGSGIGEMILQLYEYAVASPQPVRWLQSCAAAYKIPEGASYSSLSFAGDILDELKQTVSDCFKVLEKTVALAQLPCGPQAYVEVLRADEGLLQELLECDSLEDFELLITELTFGRLPSRRSKAMAGADDFLCEQIMELRGEVKEVLKGLVRQYFQLPGELAAEQMRLTAENIQVYTELTIQFMERLEEKKRKKNILDFSDQEHLALQILTREENGVLVPSETADIFADYFAEIMVDEYQDSNLVQEAILNSICGSRKGRDDRFMVGDVKQSIYRFRQAEPGLFLEKYGRYEDGDGGVRIDLHQNFRSRDTVLTPVNELFGRIMCRELGGIEYDESAALKPGAVYPELEASQAELLLLSQEEWEDLRGECGWTKQEAEAHLIAWRIKRMLAGEQVTEAGELRPVRPGDIVILLRTMSGWSETFVRVLQDEGIPASAQSRTGYFETLEVETILSYLKVLDNPVQEIPLAAALHGMLGGFSSEELAKIRTLCPEKDFTEACRRYREEGPEEELRLRLDDFYRQADRYRELAACTSMHELLWQILTETGYLDQVQALPSGGQRLANMEMLLKKAQDYEKISYHGLFHFIRYIERLQRYQVDFGEADISGKGSEAVRIMSTHHSKGLEFPVVFAAGMGKSFNRQEGREKAVMSSRYGVGLDYVDLKERMRCPTILKRFIRRRNLLDSLGEELRILYVAMTRAKEKLVLTGMAKEKLLEEEGASGEEKLLFLKLSNAEGCLTWILSGMNAEDSSIQKEKIPLADLAEQAVRQQVKRVLTRDEMEKLILFRARDEKLYEQVDERLSWSYPWAGQKQTKQKYSVTELKRRRVPEESDSSEELYEEPDIVPLIPQFIEKPAEAGGAARGTIYHMVMEGMDFGQMTEPVHVDQELDRLVKAGRITEEDKQAVRREDFLTFAGTGLARRMQKAKEQGSLYREQPFVIGLPGSEFPDADPEETVLVQGIIDAFFYEDGEIVVVDYKTDYVTRPEELAEKYRSQLAYYARALQMLTGKTVKERLIYSFRLGKVIKL